MSEHEQTRAAGAPAGGQAEGHEVSDGDALAAVIVLAAGQGTRMRSSVPKMLHELGGRTMLGHVLAASAPLRARRTAVVVRHEAGLITEHVRAALPEALVVEQDAVPGTGSAVRAALSVLDAAAHAAQAASGVVPDGQEGQVLGDGVEGAVLVVAGDLPLLDTATLQALADAHLREGNAVTVLTTVVDDPAGYGRVVRDAATGDVLRVVEHRDADDHVLAIREVNSSVYVFDAGLLRAGIAALTTHNAQGELYLTDVLQHAREQGAQVRAVVAEDPSTVEGANDHRQLARLRRLLNDRVLDRWMLAGVTVVDPVTTWVDVDVELAPDVTILPGTQLLGATRVEEGATVGPDTTLKDTEVGAGATVVRTHAELAVVGAGASVGPFAYLRPGSVLGAKAKVGTFVETKNARLERGAKVPHLSYVGDASIGEGTNIGAATVFVNYDGVTKNRTTVGANVRVGADNMLVAPVTIGDGAYTGAGSVIRSDVPAGALGVSAGPQRNIEGWVERRRAGTASAHAAQAAGAPTGDPDAAPEQDQQQVEPPTTTGSFAALGAQAQAELASHVDAAAAERPTSPHSDVLDSRHRTEGHTDR